MLRHYVPILIVILAILTLQVQAQGQPYHLSGTIFGNGSPLPGVMVTLNDGSTNNRITSTTSDLSGFYLFEVQNGLYDLDLTPAPASGYEPAVVNNITVNGANVQQNVVLIRQTEPPPPPTENYYALSGNVFASNGMSGVAGLRVLATNHSNNTTTNVRTTTAGAYRMVLLEGDYRVRVSKASVDQLPFPSPRTFNLTQNSDHLLVTTDTVQNFTLPENCHVAGNVTYEGSPHTSVSISAICQAVDGTSTFLTESAEDGTFSGYLFPGTVTITATPIESTILPTVITMEVTTETVVNVELSERTSSRLTGTVVTYDGLTSVSGIRVNTTINGSTSNTVTDANGRFAFDVESGTYPLSVSKALSHTLNIPAPRTISVTGYGSVEVGDTSGTSDHTLLLPEFITLSGTVTLDGAPFPGVLLTGSLSTPGSHSSSMNVTSSVDGTYSVLMVKGMGTITANPPDETGLLTWPQSVIAEGDLVHNINFKAEIPQLSGIVTASDGNPVSGVQVQTRLPNNQTTTTITDAEGLFYFFVAPHTYTLSFLKRSSNIVNTTSPRTFDLIDEISVELTESEFLETTLPEVLQLSGRATDRNGVGVTSVTVSANTTSEDLRKKSSDVKTTNANGEYVLNLFPGLWNINITPKAGSGFLPVKLTNLPANNDILQNIILELPDTQQPRIIAGPYANSIDDKSALIQWQTDEPATSDLIYGTSGSLSLSASEPGYRTQHAVRLSNLTALTSYTVQVTSMDKSNNLVADSNIIVFATLDQGDGIPPSFVSGPIISQVGSSLILGDFSTDEPTSAVVYYGTSLATLNRTFAINSLATAHQFKLEGLTPGTQYYLQVHIADAVGNGPTTSTILQAVTGQSADNTPPVISGGPIAIGINQFEASINWITNEPSSSGVSYNDGTANGLVQDPQLVSQHSMRLTGLTPDTLYTYTVSSTDGSNNGPTASASQTFRTLADPDTTAPAIIEGPTVGQLMQDSALIRWTTNEPSDGVLRYGTTLPLVLTLNLPQLDTDHQILLTGLTTGTLYFYDVASKDAAGNGPTTSTVRSFTTPADPDIQPPVILSGPALMSGSQTPVLQWMTDEVSNSAVTAITTGGEVLTWSDANWVRDHRVTLAGVEVGREYQVTVTSADPKGNSITANVTATAGTTESKAITRTSVDMVHNGSSLVGIVLTNQADRFSPQVVSGPEVVWSDASSAIILWSTNEPADSRLEFGSQGSVLGFAEASLVPTLDHKIILTNLTPAGNYDLRVASRDGSGNISTWSNIINFVTSANADEVAPEFAISPSVVFPNDNSGLISFVFSEHATAQLFYGLSISTLNIPAGTDNGHVLAHTIPLTHLSSGQTYYYQVEGVDVVGNGTVSAINSFTAPIRTGIADWSVY